MSPQQAYNKILFAIQNNKINKKDKWSKRLLKKYKIKKKIRVPEYECFLINDVYYSYKYAIDCIKGKLPEKMHNMMLCYYFSENAYAKKYFDFCKEK